MYSSNRKADKTANIDNIYIFASKYILRLCDRITGQLQLSGNVN